MYLGVGLSVPDWACLLNKRRRRRFGKGYIASVFAASGRMDFRIPKKGAGMPPLHAFAKFFMCDVLKVGEPCTKSRRPTVLAGLLYLDSECAVYYGRGAVIVASSRETAPERVRARPSSTAPVLSVIEVSARIFPANVDVVPSVADEPTCQ